MTHIDAMLECINCLHILLYLSLYVIVLFLISAAKSDPKVRSDLCRCVYQSTFLESCSHNMQQNLKDVFLLTLNCCVVYYIIWM